MNRPFDVHFPDGQQATAIRVDQMSGLPGALTALGLAQARPGLVVVGGAGKLDAHNYARLRPLFQDVLAPLAEKVGAYVVDGGTDAGVMRLMGEARAAIHATFPLLGVAVDRTVVLPGGVPPRPDAAELERHHTHFVLVPGTEWGDEVVWLADSATQLAAGVPSVTILVNGGHISWRDVAESVRSGRRVIAVAGSGRTADALADALRSGKVDESVRSLVGSGLLEAIDLNDARQTLTHTLEPYLIRG